MTIERITTKTAHLERTSEADKVPAEWAIAEIRRHLDGLTVDERKTAMLCGWTHAKLEYQHERDPLEMAQDRLTMLREGILAGSSRGEMTRDELLALLAAAGV